MIILTKIKNILNSEEFCNKLFNRISLSVYFEIIINKSKTTKLKKFLIKSIKFFNLNHKVIMIYLI